MPSAMKSYLKRGVTSPFRCGRCLSKTSVYDTRYCISENVTQRRRICAKGHRFTTVESLPAVEMPITDQDFIEIFLRQSHADFLKSGNKKTMIYEWLAKAIVDTCAVNPAFIARMREPALKKEGG